ncbi:MAG: hypothetical protein ABI759_08945 [Candidatus Solibacter sp.]
MSRARQQWGWAALLVAANWFANFLHFRGMGLYEDDWYFVGYAFTASFKQWMVDCLWNQWSIPAASVGRPFQFLFSFSFAEIGALANSLAVDYVIAFLASSLAALLMYRMLTRRFGMLPAGLATLLFVISPLHTLHQSLIYQFSLGPAFSLLFGAMMLYVAGRKRWSYFLAVLSLLTYESVYFLFLAAPLMRRGRMWQGRRREWLAHLAMCSLIVAGYYAFRMFTGEARVTSLPHGRELLEKVVSTWLVYMANSFAPYYYAALRAWREGNVESWFYASAFGAAAAALAHRAAPKRRVRWLANLVRPAMVGLVFLALGFLLAYFVLLEPTPRLPFTDRNTRASLAASFGSSVLVAALLCGLLRRVSLAAVSAAGIAILFAYAFLLQQDYVKDWAMQAATVRQFMALTPDVAEDSILILRFPSVDPSLAGQPAIGADQDGFDEVIKHTFSRSQKLPTLFIVVSDDWPNYLQRTPDGFLEWKAPFFPGRWYASSGRYRPGRFIVLDEQTRGHMVRKNDPMMVAGQQIVQQAPPVTPESKLWTSLQRTPLYGKLLPQGTPLR